VSQDRGIYDKFIVTRTDGAHMVGKKHEGCLYFVLDLDHDLHAKPALKAYAESCRETHPMLSMDLTGLADLLPLAPRGCSCGDDTHHGAPVLPQHPLAPWIRHRDLCGALDGGACSCGLTAARKEVGRG